MIYRITKIKHTNTQWKQLNEVFKGKEKVQVLAYLSLASAKKYS